MSIVQTNKQRRWSITGLLSNPGATHRILGAATALTLLANPTDTFFLPDAHGPRPTCGPVAQWTLFCLLETRLELARWLLFAFCVPLVMGICMPIAGVLHLYAALAVSLTTLGVEGGDQLSVNVSALLTLCALIQYPQRWRHSKKTEAIVSQLILVIIACITLQLAFVYFEAGVGKMAQQQWQEGTALWYWFQNSAYTGPPTLSNVALFFLGIPLISGLASWGTVAFQLCLTVVILAVRNVFVRRVYLAAGIIFHLVIWIMFGLPSFGIVMSACLLLVLGGENYLCRLGDRWLELLNGIGKRPTEAEGKG